MHCSQSVSDSLLRLSPPVQLPDRLDEPVTGKHYLMCELSPAQPRTPCSPLLLPSSPPFMPLKIDFSWQQRLSNHYRCWVFPACLTPGLLMWNYLPTFEFSRRTLSLFLVHFPLIVWTKFCLLVSLANLDFLDCVYVWFFSLLVSAFCCPLCVPINPFFSVLTVSAFGQTNNKLSYLKSSSDWILAIQVYQGLLHSLKPSG